MDRAVSAPLDSRAIAHVVFAVLKFDFSAVEGDPLGDLYQRYFDPETRKALGEFYTPQPVVEYIMDGVGYDVGVSSERLIDPACGSGTFLVEAIERYLEDVRRYYNDPDWDYHLRELCTGPRIVGLDIHPFAVLMAQIRFMVAILPAYREAKRAEPSFTIRRLPIFRTDSLRNEREMTGIDLGEEGEKQMTWDALSEDGRDVRIPVPLPVEVDPDEVAADEREGKFLKEFVRMPLFDTIRLNTGVTNFGEYYAALQGVLDVVKYHMSEELYEYRGGLAEGIGRYTTRDYDGLDEFFAPYVDDILETVQYLQEEHGDGRLFKMFEDTVLSLVLKNYMKYDYVVGNPPYVRQEHITSETKQLLEQLYPDIYDGRGDISIYFLRRATDFLTNSGTFGYITSNKFTKSNYGVGLREYLSENVTLQSVVDFADAEVFSDATTYAMVLIASKKAPTANSRFTASLVNTSIEDLDEPLEYAFSHLEADDEHVWTFEVTHSNLDSKEWRFVPQELYDVTDKIRSKSTHVISDLGKVVMGMRPGMNDAFVIESKAIDEFNIEDDVLRECLKGKDTERYFSPPAERWVIYTPELDRDEHPGAFRYISQFETELRDREQFKSRDDMEWWEIEQPISAEIFDSDKLLTPSFSKKNSFSFDERGVSHLDTTMSVVLDEGDTELYHHLLAILNTEVIEVVFKQIATLVQQKYYRYYQQHIEPLPVIVPSDGATEIGQKAEQIKDALKLLFRTERFPEPYVRAAAAELEYIDYEWQTRRYPVAAEIQELTDGRFAVTAGRSDEITDPRMDRGDRESREFRARYVHAVVDGRNVKSGEEQSIPIPKRDADVRTLLDELEADSQTVEETDIKALEAEIDNAVYDLFDLNDDERNVIEDYLEVF